MDKRRRTKPDWLKVKLPIGKKYADVKDIVTKNKLHTICQSGNCPNIGECWGAGTATFMILGNICTRSCKFCAVTTGKPLPPDPDEPENIARSVVLMNLKHVVLTSVDRDDLPDGGANHWVRTIEAIRNSCPETTIESLIPDFDAKENLLKQIADIRPEIVSHNMETVERLSSAVRSRARYRRSLDTLRLLSQHGAVTKSGIMVGLGETDEEVTETMADILNVNCKIITIGQYLQPTKEHWPVNRWVTPEIFEYYRKKGLEMGFEIVESAPLVRSSYHAEKHYRIKG